MDPRRPHLELEFNARIMIIAVSIHVKFYRHSRYNDLSNAYQW